jgi:hypothetical protein
LRDASLRFRPCAAVVEGAVANESYSRVGSRRLVLQREASFVNSAVLRGVGRFVVVLSVTAARQMAPCLESGGGLQAARCCGPSGARSPERATIATARPTACKIGRPWSTSLSAARATATLRRRRRCRETW